MERTCARAVDLGLAAVAFTEHADYTSWTVLASDLDEHEHLKAFVTPDGTLTPPNMDLNGYLECVQRCRDRFPDLRIISGVELGEPHWHSGVAGRLLEAGHFDRVLGSLHCLPVDQRFCEPPELYKQRPAATVIREYLAEIPRLITSSDAFAVLAHIDYPVRHWPAQAGRFDPNAFEDEFRHALRVLADSDRALEVNTQVPLHPEIVRWWREEGGIAISFGSDAHDPTALAHGFTEAAAMVEAHGFRPGGHPYDFWTRSGPTPLTPRVAAARSACPVIDPSADRSGPGERSDSIKHAGETVAPDVEVVAALEVHPEALGRTEATPLPLPNGLPIIERSAVRLVVLDAQDKVLLFHTHDPDHPDLGSWWELPGGGIDPGETYLEAAIRELHEETGIVADPSEIGAPIWRRRSSFRHRQHRHLQDEVIVTLLLPVPGPDVDESRRLDYEREDYFAFRWWPTRDIVTSGERFYPGQLPALLVTFLDGEEINEPFELWS
jgi:histidinol-phosphatase (PHP family)